MNAYALAALHRLEHLDLSENAINGILPNLVANMTNLNEILLARNNITFLPEHLFKNNPKLQTVNFAFNQIVSIDNTLLSPLLHHLSLDLQRNRVSSFYEQLY